MSDLKPCPCGKTPTTLELESGTKWAWATPDCCGEWGIEFHTDYSDEGTPERMALAVEEWNRAPRGWMA